MARATGRLRPRHRASLRCCRPTLRERLLQRQECAPRRRPCCSLDSLAGTGGNAAAFHNHRAPPGGCSITPISDGRPWKYRVFRPGRARSHRCCRTASGQYPVRHLVRAAANGRFRVSPIDGAPREWFTTPTRMICSLQTAGCTALSSKPRVLVATGSARQDRRLWAAGQGHSALVPPPRPGRAWVNLRVRKITSLQDQRTQVESGAGIGGRRSVGPGIHG